MCIESTLAGTLNGLGKTFIPSFISVTLTCLLYTSTQGTKLERTGENFTSTYTIIGSLMVVLVGAGLFVLKKKEFIEC